MHNGVGKKGNVARTRLNIINRHSIQKIEPLLRKDHRIRVRVRAQGHAPPCEEMVDATADVYGY
jgi:hypothetical protein